MMIRRVNLVNLFSQYAHLNEKCRLLSRVISTSHVCGNGKLKKSNRNTARQVLDVSKTNYEDTFGNLDSFEQMFNRIEDDPEDIQEYIREKRAQGKSLGNYVEEIKFHLANYNYKSALKVLEVDMVNDKIKPITYIYKVLISYNAKQGNLQEAYRLFTNFKKRNGEVTGAIYTSMFNACALCSNSFLAIEKANAIETHMRNNKQHSINSSNYNVMLKAYGRHGDLPTCLKIVDEVLEKRDKVKCITFNFLLEACISDKNSGFRHALIIWRKMLQNLVKPDSFTFLSLVKCAGSCSIGDTVLVSEIINDLKNESGKFFSRKVVVRTIDGEKNRKVLKIPASGDHLITPIEEDKSESPVKNKNDFIQLQSIESNESGHLALEKGEASETNTEVSQVEMCNLGNQLINLEENKSGVVTESTENSLAVESYTEKCREAKEKDPPLIGSELPNLLALNPSLGSVVDFGVMTQPHHRFMLVGGVKGFLKTMAEFGVEPCIKIFTSMLEVIPPTLEAEQELLSIMKTRKAKFDTAFFNSLMKRRLMRDEDHSIKDSLKEMYSLNLQPDIITFGVLSLGCRTRELGMDLLKTLRNYGYRANTVILETLLDRARRARDMNYVLDILRAAKEDDSDISPRFIALVSDTVKNERYLRRNEEKQKLEETEKLAT